MKLKKFFAGVLAAAMMLTVGATAAFATTPEYTTTPDNVDLGIMKNYKVEKGTAPKEDFTFSVTYVPDKSKPYTTAYTGYDGTYKQPEAKLRLLLSRAIWMPKQRIIRNPWALRFLILACPKAPVSIALKLRKMSRPIKPRVSPMMRPPVIL